MPFVKKFGFTFKPSFNFKDIYVIKMIKLFAPGIFGASVYQINLLVSTAFAGAIGEGRVSVIMLFAKQNSCNSFWEFLP